MTPATRVVEAEYERSLRQSKPLSKREKQLLDLLYTDMQAKNFHIEMGLSPKTVKLYLSRLFMKIHVTNGRIEVMSRKINELRHYNSQL